jgi:hypothetical protein
MTRKYALKGTNSDTETCEKCGKTGLKSVMWLVELDEDGNETAAVTPFGTTCGAKALGFNDAQVSKFSTVEQVGEAHKMTEKLDRIMKNAQDLANEYNDEVGIIRHRNYYTMVRGKAFDANPNRYDNPTYWVKPE